ncbi:MAG: hypothetical protein NZ653_08965 [Anaerolineae bacterium]|nr:hypothetical protein [Anaerolineae bacterium]
MRFNYGEIIRGIGDMSRAKIPLTMLTSQHPTPLYEESPVSIVFPGAN